MEAFIVAGIIFIAIILNSLTYLSGVLATPANAVYLGTVHWPGDYFYYLSQFTQGRYNWFFSYDLYSRDFPVKTLVGWVNVFLGRLFLLVGIDNLTAYQLSVVIFAGLFLLLSFWLIREIFPGKSKENRWKRIIAFILFVFSNAFPKIIYTGGRWTWSYYDYWFNNGLPFNRLVAVPHQLIARAGISLILLLAIAWWRRQVKGKLVINIIAFTITGFILASVDPVHWVIVSAVIFTVPFIASISYFNKQYITKYIRIVLFQLMPFAFFFGSGLPMAVYLKQLFSQPPYLQLAMWELTQTLHLNLRDFILANGPVMVLALLGIFQFSKKISKAKITALIFSLVTIILFLSPLPSLVGVVNARFLPATATIFLACFATEAIWRICQKAGRKLYTVIILLVLITLGIGVAPLIQQQEIRTKTDTANGFFYLDKKVYAAYDKAQQISGYGDLFLVVWPFNWSFPGITARHSFTGHTLLTIDIEKKEKDSAGFFYEGMNGTEMEKFLLENKINYVMAYPWMVRIDTLPVLNKLFDNGMLAIYRVKGK